MSIFTVICQGFSSLNLLTSSTRVSPSDPVQEFQKSMVIGAEASASSAPAAAVFSVDAAVVLSAAGADVSLAVELLPPQPASEETTITVLKSKASFFDFIINPPFVFHGNLKGYSMIFLIHM